MNGNAVTSGTAAAAHGDGSVGDHFGQTPAARARETDISERTLRRKADDFDDHGMASLVDQPAAPVLDRRRLPVARLVMTSWVSRRFGEW